MDVSAAEAYELRAAGGNGRHFTLDVTNRVLVERGAALEVYPQSLDVLILLVRKAGSLVSRQEFSTSVWKGAAVEDSALTRCISEIRHTLGDSAEHPLFVATKVKHGYVFVGTAKRTGVLE